MDGGSSRVDVRAPRIWADQALAIDAPVNFMLGICESEECATRVIAKAIAEEEKMLPPVFLKEILERLGYWPANRPPIPGMERLRSTEGGLIMKPETSNRRRSKIQRRVQKVSSRVQPGAQSVECLWQWCLVNPVTALSL